MNNTGWDIKGIEIRFRSLRWRITSNETSATRMTHWRLGVSGIGDSDWHRGDQDSDVATVTCPQMRVSSGIKARPCPDGKHDDYPREKKSVSSVPVSGILKRS